MREERKLYKVLLGKPKGKRPLRRLRHRWENGMRIDFTETGWEDAEWVQLAQDRGLWQTAVNVVMNLWGVQPWS
jgi:hypothetical protein